MKKFDLFYLPETKNPKGIIQIIHGMGEHCNRYSKLGEYFSNKGYIVVGEDFEEHGNKAKNIGILEINLEELVEAQKILTIELSKKYPQTPIYVLGHSMGSFIAQEHMKKSLPKVKGYIFQGSSYKNPFLWNLGKLITGILSKIYGKKRALLVKKIIFRGNNSHFKNEKDEYSWLTRDKEVRKEFQKDDRAGFAYSGEFYYNFFRFINKLYIEESFVNIDRNIEIFLVSGTEDPVSGYGKSVLKLFNFYKKLGFKNIVIELKEGFRHELHNEIGKEIYFSNILEWIEKNE